MKIEALTEGHQVEVLVPSLMRNWMKGDVTLVTHEEVLVVVPGETVRFRYNKVDSSWVWLTKYAGSIETRPALLRWPTSEMLRRLFEELGPGEDLEDWARELVASEA